MGNSEPGSVHIVFVVVQIKQIREVLVSDVPGGRFLFQQNQF